MIKLIFNFNYIHMLLSFITDFHNLSLHSSALYFQKNNSLLLHKFQKTLQNIQNAFIVFKFHVEGNVIYYLKKNQIMQFSYMNIAYFNERNTF